MKGVCDLAAHKKSRQGSWRLFLGQEFVTYDASFPPPAALEIQKSKNKNGGKRRSWD
jgi:hypothetical protein